MKKEILSVLAACVAAFSLTACKSGTAEESEKSEEISSEAVTSAAEPEETEAEVTEEELSLRKVLLIDIRRGLLLDIQY